VKNPWVICVKSDKAIRRGYNVSFTTQGKLATQLQSARATHLYQRRLSTLAKVDLLIIDDFGLKPLHSPQDEDFHELISERYERRATVVTSNLEFSEWVEAFPNRLLGATVIDRLGHGAYRYEMSSIINRLGAISRSLVSP